MGWAKKAVTVSKQVMIMSNAIRHNGAKAATQQNANQASVVEPDDEPTGVSLSNAQQREFDALEHQGQSKLDRLSKLDKLKKTMLRYAHKAKTSVGTKAEMWAKKAVTVSKQVMIMSNAIRHNGAKAATQQNANQASDDLQQLATLRKRMLKFAAKAHQNEDG